MSVLPLVSVAMRLLAADVNAIRLPSDEIVGWVEAPFEGTAAKGTLIGSNEATARPRRKTSEKGPGS